jgi:hypothetical protein
MVTILIKLPSLSTQAKGENYRPSSCFNSVKVFSKLICIYICFVS